MSSPTATLKLNRMTDLLSRTAMTPIERLHGRFMRAPDHGAGDGGDLTLGADGGTGNGGEGVDGGKGAGAAESKAAGQDDGSTILGGAPSDDEASDGKPKGESDGDGEQKADGDPAAQVPETYDLKPPEGFEKLDDEAVAFAEPVFKELKLSNEQANKLMPVAGQFAARITAQRDQQIMDAVNQQRKEWADAFRDDEEIGGARCKETEELAAKGLDAAGFPKGHPFRNALTDSGFGNHPDMIRLCRKFGELVGEDMNFARGSAPKQPKAPEAQLYSEEFQPKS